MNILLEPLAWDAYVNVICAIISTISILLAAILWMIDRCKKLKVKCYRANSLTEIFLCPLKNSTTLIRMKIFGIANKQEILLNEQDQFFINGEKEIDLEYKTYTKIKILQDIHLKTDSVSNFSKFKFVFSLYEETITKVCKAKEVK